MSTYPTRTDAKAATARKADRVLVEDNFDTTSGARMPCDFPLEIVFATSISGRFVKLKTNKIKRYDIG